MAETVKWAFLAAAVMFGTGSAGVFAQATPKGIDPVFPTTVSNSNVWKIYHDYQVMIEEIDKSVTKGNAGTLSHDATRWRAYLNGFRAYTAYWQTQAFLDMPVSHGRNWDIADPLNPPCEFKDNTAACELMALVVTARDELILSASAELPMHLYGQDLTRQQSYWDAMEGYIGFMETNTPMDEPITAAEENLGLKPGFDHKEP